MMRCPSCGSKAFSRSHTHDRTLYRVLLVARARCNCCFEVFLAPRWAVKDTNRRPRLRPQPLTDLSGSQKKPIF